MTPSFSRFDACAVGAFAVFVAAAMSAAAAIAAFLGNTSIAAPIAITSTFVATTALMLNIVGRRSHKDVIARIAQVCDQIIRGNFEARIVDIRERGPSADAQHAVNDMIDRCDAFVRELTASLEAVCRNVYYRKILPGGLNGAFRSAADIINASVSAQAAAVEDARVKSAEELQRLIEQIGQQLRTLAEGDLASRLHGLPQAYKKIEFDFNAASERLAGALEGVIVSANFVDVGTREIAAAADDLARRTEQQATTIQETTSSVQQLTEAIGRTASSSTRTKDIISEAKAELTANVGVVHETESSIDRIKGWSEKISSIIGVIDGIAFQTNLLALNAGVEAARAGEAGRGFAVVASEVRALAQRCTEAAREITVLVSNSTGEVTNGVELVKATSAAFDRIKSQISLIDSGIGEIANQAMEQTISLKQINIVVTEVEQTTQRNAAMAEETSAACQSLTQECANMARMTAGFQLPSLQTREPEINGRFGEALSTAA